jgi:hypothetical protein
VTAAKSLAFVPAIEILERANCAGPLFASSAVRAVAVVPTGSWGNVSVAGVRLVVAELAEVATVSVVRCWRRVKTVEVPTTPT